MLPGLWNCCLGFCCHCVLRGNLLWFGQEHLNVRVFCSIQKQLAWYSQWHFGLETMFSHVVHLLWIRILLGLSSDFSGDLWILWLITSKYLHVFGIGVLSSDLLTMATFPNIVRCWVIFCDLVRSIWLLKYSLLFKTPDVVVVMILPDVVVIMIYSLETIISRLVICPLTYLGTFE